jgi:hypothetical protein
MCVDQIDQVTVNVKNLDESVKLFYETFGILFLPTREVAVWARRSQLVLRNDL